MVHLSMEDEVYVYHRSYTTVLFSPSFCSNVTKPRGWRMIRSPDPPEFVRQYNGNGTDTMQKLAKVRVRFCLKCIFQKGRRGRCRCQTSDGMERKHPPTIQKTPLLFPVTPHSPRVLISSVSLYFTFRTNLWNVRRPDIGHSSYHVSLLFMIAPRVRHPERLTYWGLPSFKV